MSAVHSLKVPSTTEVTYSQVLGIRPQVPLGPVTLSITTTLVDCFNHHRRPLLINPQPMFPIPPSLTRFPMVNTAARTHNLPHTSEVVYFSHLPSRITLYQNTSLFLHCVNSKASSLPVKPFLTSSGRCSLLPGTPVAFGCHILPYSEVLCVSSLAWNHVSSISVALTALTSEPWTSECLLSMECASVDEYKPRPR